MRATRLYLIFALAGALTAADFEVGRLAYEKGDFATAMKEWQPLAEIGAPFASYNLGLMYAKGQGVKQDYAEAAKWYLKAAEKGVPEAEYNLGVMYSMGTGVPKDYSEASKWFQKAAEKGDANAANSIGTLYNAGEGSFQNFAEAAKWYRKAAEEGNSNAQFNLGVMYDIGQGVPPDFAQAEKWYRKASEQWNEGALCNLAILYYNGEGLKRDLVQSHEYFLLAKEAGDPRAANLMELTTEKLTKKQMEKAQQLAEEFKGAHKQQILAARNPVQKAPGSSDQGPEAGGLYAKAVKGGDEVLPVAVAAAVQEAPKSKALPGVWTGVERIVAVGDVHGDYQQFAAVLRSANLIDAQDNWAGGKTHLVQTGDVVDEGPDSRRIMDLLAKLETQALAAGGYVHCLIGNHEAMDVYGDLRFVSPAGFGEYRDANSEKTRERYYQQELRDREAYAKSKGAMATEVAPREDWLRQHPPGFFEQREAFAPDGVYGKWIRSHNAVVQINDILFSHAGVGPKYASYSLDRINKAVRDELANQQSLQGGIVTDLQGPLWYTGLAQGADAKPAIDQVLQQFHVTREVVAHVDGAAAVLPMYGGKVIMIDVGLSRVRDNVGTQACLIVDGQKLYALHRGTRLELPKDDGTDMLRYLKQAAALDPEPSPLAARIQVLEAKLASQ
jgi:TPR repeat protein